MTADMIDVDNLKTNYRRTFDSNIRTFFYYEILLAFRV
jgi:hypothetical protein